MGIREDREEFNTSGWRRVLAHAMQTADEAFIRLDASGWQGEQVPDQPAPGSGPYIHYRRGSAVLRYENASPGDTRYGEVQPLL